MAEQTFSKEVKNYGQNVNDFIGESEITVTITLREYRELVTRDAMHNHEIEKQDKRYWELRREKDDVQAKLDSVLAKLTAAAETDVEVRDGER